MITDISRSHELLTAERRHQTYKQTAAFDQFLIYSHLASRGHGRPGAYGRRRRDAAVAHNTLLSINPEGDLLKEVKDVIDEIHIILKTQAQQQAVMRAFVKHVRQILLTRRRRPGRPGIGRRVSSEDYYYDDDDDDEEEEEEEEEDNGDGPGRRDRNAEELDRRTRRRADDLLGDVEDRTSELLELLNSAKTTSAALKDLLALKQQQVDVIEARESVKIASETKKQGQYTVTFTGITIIFVQAPLSPLPNLELCMLKGPILTGFARCLATSLLRRGHFWHERRRD